MAQHIPRDVDVGIDEAGKDKSVLGIDFGASSQRFAGLRDSLYRPIGNADIGARKTVRADDCSTAD